VSKYFSGLSANTFLIALASLFADTSTEMLYPVLPVFLTATLGASVSSVGLMEGLAQATQNIVQGFSGWLADKLRQRKPIAILGYALAAVAKPLIGLSTGVAGRPRCAGPRSPGVGRPVSDAGGCGDVQGPYPLRRCGVGMGRGRCRSPSADRREPSRQRREVHAGRWVDSCVRHA